jgi:hypothetical protein
MVRQVYHTYMSWYERVSNNLYCSTLVMALQYETSDFSLLTNQLLVESYPLLISRVLILFVANMANAKAVTAE